MAPITGWSQYAAPATTAAPVPYRHFSRALIRPAWSVWTSLMAFSTRASPTSRVVSTLLTPSSSRTSRSASSLLSSDIVSGPLPVTLLFALYELAGAGYTERHADVLEAQRGERLMQGLSNLLGLRSAVAVLSDGLSGELEVDLIEVFVVLRLTVVVLPTRGYGDLGTVRGLSVSPGVAHSDSLVIRCAGRGSVSGCRHAGC